MTSRMRTPHAAALAVAAFLVLAVFGCLAALQTATAPAASAHDFLIKTTPADGATVEHVPGMVRLVFDQPAQQIGTKMVVTGPRGPVQQGSPTLVDNQVRQQIAPGAPAGHYTVSWRITSADGHPVSGSFSFTAKEAAAGTLAPSTRAQADPAKTGATDSNSLLIWGGGAVLVIVLIVIGWLIRRRS
ncbi:hypothetical protein GCM10011492_22600 [Flexivirga endophytica]|uniref:CopC domain-containing protein n=1 Tax=Flexivirga endophytica TaxID=1849103 RepID=A0A916T6X8_9MICO|nr:copper resistance CopC family protein [Flexivirga endophytica]GGB31439.1 hypothetical protein GCM10011492_22600 [Flexivirga endophytica]GHB52396.1 hypothetical protein GCM10008112_21870 [Flexivirga endophytica]